MKKRGPVSVSGEKEGGDECARYGQRDKPSTNKQLSRIKRTTRDDLPRTHKVTSISPFYSHFLASHSSRYI